MKCKNCKKKISIYANRCPYCNAEVKKLTSGEKEYEEYIKGFLTKSSLEQGRPKKLLGRNFRCIAAIACTMAAMLVAVACCGKRIYNRQFEGERVYYIKGEELYLASVDSGKEKQLTSGKNEKLGDDGIAEIEEMVCHEDDKHHLLYYAADIGNDSVVSYTLYAQDMEDLLKKPMVVGKNVRLMTRDKEGNLYYVTNDTACLYRFDGETTTKMELPFVEQLLYEEKSDSLVIITDRTMGREVKDDIDYKAAFSEEMKVVEAEKDLYLVDCKQFSAEKKLEGYTGEFAVTKECDEVYYLKNNQLYLIDVPTGTTVRLKENVANFVLAKGDRLYYLSYVIEEKSYYDFITDSCLKEDKKSPHTKAAAARNELRNQLKEEKVLMFDGTLHERIDGEDTVIAEHVGNMYENGTVTDRSGPRYEYEEQKISVATLSKDEELRIYQKVIQFLDHVTIEGEDLDGSILCLYDYRNLAMAIPQEVEAYCINKHKVYSYDGETKKETVYEGEDDPPDTYVPKGEIELSFGNVSYKIKEDDMISLYKQTETGEEIVAKGIVSYRKIGTDAIVTRQKDKDAEYGDALYAYSGKGKVQKLAERVSRILGEIRVD